MHRPGAAARRGPVGRARVTHARCHGGDDLLVFQRAALACATPVGIDEDMDAALAVQQDRARSVPRDRAKAQRVQHLAQGLGPGGSRIYFVARHREFSIYDVDFVPIPGVDPRPPALAGLHFFGIVQYIGNGRTEDWTDFYRELFGFQTLPLDATFGILPKGRILRSPCPQASAFYLQLIEPEPGILEVDDTECFQRVALGTADVLATVAELRTRGVSFVESGRVHSEDRGALTQTRLGGVSFELVHHTGP